MIYQSIILALLVAALPLAAQATERDVNDDVFTLTVENDSLGSGADRNYTSGVRFSWLQHYAQPTSVARTFDSLLPLDMLNETTTMSYSIGQNLYTPKITAAHIPDPKDRPYAGFLYGSMAIAASHDHHSDNVELTVGIIGPASLGRESQQFIHTLLDAGQPEGWGYQLKNELGLMASWERTWPNTVQAEMGDVVLRGAPYAGATLGNIFTYANTGLVFQLLPKAYQQQNTPLRTRPGLAGNGYAQVPDDDFAWCVFAGLEGRAVGRNIFLDGNTFTDSASVGKNPLVADANAGVAFNYGRAQISYTLNWRSPEFAGQDNTDLFGSVGLSYRF